MNNGGLFVKLEGIQAFCPGSHIPQVRTSLVECDSKSQIMLFGQTSSMYYLCNESNRGSNAFNLIKMWSDPGAEVVQATCINSS